MPTNAERYLEETYGLDWRKPDKGFASVISSPALYDVDPYITPDERKSERRRPDRKIGLAGRGGQRCFRAGI